MALVVQLKETILKGFFDDDLVTDKEIIETRAPKTIEWYLHADAPFEPQGTGYRVGDGRAALLVAATAPPGTRTTTDATVLTAPGQPGAITTGPQEKRGYQLLLQTPAATSVSISVSLTLVR